MASIDKLISKINKAKSAINSKVLQVSSVVETLPLH